MIQITGGLIINKHLLTSERQQVYTLIMISQSWFFRTVQCMVWAHDRLKKAAWNKMENIFIFYLA